MLYIYIYIKYTVNKSIYTLYLCQVKCLYIHLHTEMKPGLKKCQPKKRWSYPVQKPDWSIPTAIRVEDGKGDEGDPRGNLKKKVTNASNQILAASYPPTPSYPSCGGLRKNYEAHQPITLWLPATTYIRPSTSPLFTLTWGAKSGSNKEGTLTKTTFLVCDTWHRRFFCWKEKWCGKWR